MLKSTGVGEHCHVIVSEFHVTVMMIYLIVRNFVLKSTRFVLKTTNFRGRGWWCTKEFQLGIKCMFGVCATVPDLL